MVFWGSIGIDKIQAAEMFNFNMNELKGSPCSKKCTYYTCSKSTKAVGKSDDIHLKNWLFIGYDENIRNV